jgi:hypothetical protein
MLITTPRRMYHWRDEAILVNTEQVELRCPPGVNLVQQAIETLNKKKDKAREEYMETCAKMDDLISRLTLITYQPEPEMEAVIVPGYDGEPDVDIIPKEDDSD